MDLDINQYLSIFVEESKEHLQIMNDVMLQLERDPENLNYINEIFRVAHTLKGMSGTMGFHNMADLTHEMENLLQAARSEEIKLTDEVIDILFECFDALDASVDSIVEEGKESEDKNEELINKIFKALDRESESVGKINSEKEEVVLDEFVVEAINKADSSELNVFRLDFLLEEDCMLKSARAFIIFNLLEETGEIIYSNPSVEEIEDEEFERNFVVIYITELTEEDMEKKLTGISEVESVEIEIFDKDKQNLVSEEEIKEKEDNKAPVNKNDNDRNKQTAAPVIRKTVRVDINRLDHLMNLVSELIIIKTRMDGLDEGTGSRSNAAETIEYLDRITTSLHDAVMKVRMVPIERVFNRFPRLVRDLSRDLKKEIRLEMSGEETEVDRTIIDEIGDPLIHLIRNSLDHGVELPEDRVKAGKPEEGTVVLKAYPDGNSVVIEVEDDGKGIDHIVVRNKAIEKGIITEEEAENLSVDDSVALLFEAGLSTSEEISDVSGRGVGLDVVKSKIESINGSIEVSTEIGKGSKFLIRIPLTLAIIQALMVVLGNETYAIPLSSVTEITTISEDKINSVQGQEVVIYRDNTIPIIRMKKVLNIQDEESNEEEKIVVIVNKGEKQAGLIVDDLLGQQEIVIKNLGDYLDNIEFISGATILGDGSISLILDINSLI